MNEAFEKYWQGYCGAIHEMLREIAKSKHFATWKAAFEAAESALGKKYNDHVIQTVKNDEYLTDRIEKLEQELNESEEYTLKKFAFYDTGYQLIEALKKINELEVMHGWQPIATVPAEDSCRILLLFEGGEVSVAYYDPYYAEGGRGYVNGFAWVEPCSGETLDLHYDSPTHWMPIPSPPQEQE